MKASRSGLFSLLALPLMGSVAALAVEAEWQKDLTADISFIHGCEVAFLSHVVEREIEGKQLIFAKVHCEDQRSFDAVRRDPGDPFEFKECTLREKQAC